MEEGCGRLLLCGKRNLNFFLKALKRYFCENSEIYTYIIVEMLS